MEISFQEQYSKIVKLGEGSFGKVYLCEKLKNAGHGDQNDKCIINQVPNTQQKNSVQKYYALKKMKMGSKDTDIMQLREVKNLVQFDHPNLIKMLGIVKQDKKYKVNQFLIFDYGLEIMELTRQKQFVLSKTQLNQIIRQIVEAVKEMHHKDYIHRDIKPSNIFLFREGIVKLGDFSISRKCKPNEPLTGNISTRFYRAPEIIYGEKIYSKQIDIWSLGCTIAELILHEPIFQGNTDINQLQTIYKIIGYPQQLWKDAEKLPYYIQFPIQEVNSLKSILPNIDQNLLDLVSSMLTLDPKKRPTIDEIMCNSYINSVQKDPSTLSTIANYIFDKKLKQYIKK